MVSCLFSDNVIAAGEKDAEDTLLLFAEEEIPVRLAVFCPCSLDLIRKASYSEKNTVHVLAPPENSAWAGEILAAAGRCGIKTAVTFTGILPWKISCADVLSYAVPLLTNYRMTFSFRIPDEGTEGTQCEGYVQAGNRSVPRRFLTEREGKYYPSFLYRQAFMENVHKYFSCTPHTAVLCSGDCRSCFT